MGRMEGPGGEYKIGELKKFCIFQREGIKCSCRNKKCCQHAIIDKCEKKMWKVGEKNKSSFHWSRDPVEQVKA